MKVSREKSEISGLGLAKGELGALCGCKTVNLLTDSIPVLGIHHSYNQTLAENRNLSSLMGGGGGGGHKMFSVPGNQED